MEERNRIEDVVAALYKIEVAILSLNPDPLQTIGEFRRERAFSKTLAVIASEQLALPVGRVYELARKGKLPVVRVGKYVRVQAAQLAQWISGRRDLAVDKNISLKYIRGYGNDRIGDAKLSSGEGPQP